MKAITHYFAYKHLKLILKEDCSIAEKKRMLRLLLRLYVPEQILANENPNHCSECGKFSDGNTCDDCQSSASSETSKETKETPTEEEKKKHTRKINQIKKGYIGRCSQEESLEVLKTNPTFTDKNGNQVKFNYTRLYEHYKLGIGRKGNIPDPKRLEELPKAIETALKGDYKLIYPEGVYPEYPGQIPKGTKRVYQLKLTHQNKILLFAFHDTGIVSGWFVPKKRGL